MEQWNHFDQRGNAVMVDVTEKQDTYRVATAQGSIAVSREVFLAIRDGTAKKGDVLGVARVAGIMASKRTAELIPLCHPLTTTGCQIEFELREASVEVAARCTVKITGKTGVEMEALTGVTVALLTIYDMCKAMDKAMTLKEIYLLKKDGGKSGNYQRDEER